METFDIRASLLLLNEQQQQAYEQLHQLEYYFYLLRHDFLNTPYAHYCMADLWIYYYYDEVPFIHSENALFYILRHYILENTVKNERFARLKKSTIQSSIPALLAAVATTNIYLDHLQQLLLALPKDEAEFYEKFSNKKRILFDPRFAKYEYYPKRIVQVETSLVQQLRQLTHRDDPEFLAQIVGVKKIIDQFILVERDFFKTLSSCGGTHNE